MGLGCGGQRTGKTAMARVGRLTTRKPMAVAAATNFRLAQAVAAVRDQLQGGLG